MIRRRRAGMLRRHYSGPLALSLSWSRALNRSLVQRTAPRQAQRLADHRPVRTGFGGGTQSLVWRLVRPPGITRALPHVGLTTLRAHRGTPGLAGRTQEPAAEAPTASARGQVETESLHRLTPSSGQKPERDPARQQGLRAPGATRPGRRPLKRTAVELPVQKRVAAERTDRPQPPVGSEPDRPTGDGRAARRDEAEEEFAQPGLATSPEKPGDAATPLPREYPSAREDLAEPEDTTVGISAEAVAPLPPLSLEAEGAGFGRPSPSDPVEAEGAEIPPSLEAVSGASAEPVLPPTVMSPPAPRASAPPSSDVPAPSVEPPREDSSGSKPGHRPPSRLWTETPGSPVAHEREGTPLPPATVARKTGTDKADTERVQSRTAEEPYLVEYEEPENEPVRRRETEETPAPAVGTQRDVEWSAQVTQETKPLRPIPVSEEMPVSSREDRASERAAYEASADPARVTQDVVRSQQVSVPVTRRKVLRMPHAASLPSPLVSRKRLAGEVRPAPVVSPAEGTLDPERMWATLDRRDLPLSGPIDSETVAAAHAGTGGMREGPEAGPTLVRLDRLLASGAGLKPGVSRAVDPPVAAQMAPLTPTISRQEASGDGGGGERGEAAASGEPAARETGPADEDSTVDLDEMARQVYGILQRRLRVEQERAGGWRW